MSLFDLPSRVGRLVLASGSPRRVQLLREAGFDPQVMPQDVDETPLPGEKAYDLVDRLASLKAHAALAQARPGDLILAADTTVALEGEELGKPADEAEARQMLRRLSGRGHDVYTAVHLILVGEDGSTRESSTCEQTHVTFFDLAEDELRRHGRAARQGGCLRYPGNRSRTRERHRRRLLQCGGASRGAHAAGD